MISGKTSSLSYFSDRLIAGGCHAGGEPVSFEVSEQLLLSIWFDMYRMVLTMHKDQ